MVYVTKSIGYGVQALVIYTIHYMVYYEINLFEDMLNELGPYERDWSYITGWPMYFGCMISYIYCCVADFGKPPPYLEFYSHLRDCEK
jgi:hypothetical protein